MSNLRHLLELEESSYNQCIPESLVAVNHNIATSISRQSAEARIIEEWNADVLAQLGDSVDRATLSLNNTMALIRRWKGEGREVELSSFCNSLERTKFESYDDLDGYAHTPASRNWTGLLAHEAERYEELMALLNSRMAYDYEYFIERRIEPAMDLIDKFSDLESPSVQFDHDALTDGIHEALRGVDGLLQHVLYQSHQLQIRIGDVEMKFQELLTEYLDLLDRFEKGVLFVQDLLPPGAPLPTYLQYDGPQNPFTLLSPLEIDILDLQYGKDVMTTTTEAILRLIEAIIHEVSVDIVPKQNHQFGGLLSKLRETLRLDDYDPPIYENFNSSHSYSPITDHVSDWSEAGYIAPYSDFGVSSADKDDENRWDNDWKTPTEEKISIPTGMKSFDYLQPLIPTVDIRDLLSVVSSIFQSKLWLVEVAIQGWRLWNIERAYGNPGNIYLSSIHKNGRVKLASLAPWRLLIATALLRVQVQTAAKLFQSTTDCQEPQDNHFLVTPFLFPMLINGANSGGNIQFLHSEAQCLNAWTRTCKGLEASIDQRFHSQIDTLSSLQLDFRSTVDELQNATSCLSETSKLEVNEACCGLKGYRECTFRNSTFVCPKRAKHDLEAGSENFFEIGERKKPYRNAIATHLKDPGFSCQQILESCSSLPCDGANELDIHDEALRAACKIENYLLSITFFCMLVLYHTCAIRACSGFLVSGMHLCCWQDLHDCKMGAISQVRADGTFVDAGTRLQRVEKINATAALLDNLGKVEVLIGCCIFLSWTSSVIS